MSEYYITGIMRKGLLCVLLLLFANGTGWTWGFYAHQKINRLAVFTLPEEMIGFYKHHIRYLTENAVNPDRRRYAVEGEAAKHYIDLDVYGDSALYTLPRYWKAAVAIHSEDTLKAYGIVPWNIDKVRYQLTNAFLKKDVKNILRLSADLGHYIGDAHVPLHTTENYNGQLTGQVGIHGFWESRMPELYSGQYDFFIGRASYLKEPQMEAWKAIVSAHCALDTVFAEERRISTEFGTDKKYSYETRGATTVRVYSKDFSLAYHKALHGMVERQMRSSIKMIGNFWYTCWVDAGQPDLNGLIAYEPTKEELEERQREIDSWKRKHIEGRDHDG